MQCYYINNITYRKKIYIKVNDHKIYIIIHKTIIVNRYELISVI